MTIASEITRLQWAKSSARTSIQNKGVTVPSSAKLDTYHTYIDRIVTKPVALTSWLRLYNNRVSGVDDIPDIYNLRSFENNGKLYWCCLCSMENYSSSSQSTYQYALYHWVKQSNSDIAYTYTSITWPWIYIWSQDGTAYSYISYTNWTKVRYYFTEYETVSWGWYTYWVYKFDWDLSNNTCTTARVGASQNPTSLFDTTWYFSLTENSRVQSATGNNIDDAAYIYLTLK